MAIPKTTLEQWAVLAAVVDHGGFAQAAIALNRSQSAVSYAVAKLQEMLDVPLLTIEGRKAVLTTHGQILLSRARAMVRELETLERLALSMKQGWEPSLHLVVDASYPRERLLNVMRELQALCPNTQMQLTEAVLSGAEEAIINDQADVVITSRVPPGFLGEWLLDVTFIAVAAPSHPLFQIDRPLTMNDLVNHTQCVVRDSGTAHPRDEGWLAAKTRCTVTGVETSLATVEAGLAFAWLPAERCAASLQRGTLRTLPLDSGRTRRLSLSLVLVRAESAGPAARAAVECFQRHLPVMQQS